MLLVFSRNKISSKAFFILIYLIKALSLFCESNLKSTRESAL